MPKATPLVNSFNGGEVSPRIDARSDINKYYSGCRVLQGMIPRVEGGAFRAPGTYYGASAKVATDKARVLPFTFSTIQGYILEFGEYYIRFFMDKGQVLSGPAVYEIATPYVEADLFELQIFQSADVMWICHPDYETRELTRTAHTSWTLTKHVAKIDDAFTITNASQANPCVLTLTYTDTAWAATTGYVVGDIRVNGNYHYYCKEAHTSGTSFATDLADGKWRRMNLPVAGDIFYVSGVGGMTEINDLFFTAGTVVDGAGTVTIQLSGIDSQTYTAYTTGGTAQKAQFGTSDNRPACGMFYEQRIFFAATNNGPQTIWASGTANYDEFTQDADDDSAAIEYTLVSDKVDRIRWMIGQDYLMLGTTGGVWRFGASSSGTPITAANVKAEKHISIGVLAVQPQQVTDAILWATRSGCSLMRLEFSLNEEKWMARDMTRISKHIALGTSQALSGFTQFAFQQEPMPILWAVRNDGQLLGLVYDIQENVFAWFRIVTDGYFESVAVISNDNEEDEVWVSVQRTINGSTVRYIEYFMPQEFFSEIKDAFFVHSGLSFDGGDEVVVSAISKAATAVVTVASWPADGDGTDLANGDKVVITDAAGMTEINKTAPFTTAYTVAGANKGALTFQLSGVNSTNYTAYTGSGKCKIVKAAFTTLDHLVGESVIANADGYSCPAETVAAGGNVTFDYFGNQVHAGLAYDSIVEPMKIHAGSNLGTSRGKKQKVTKVTCCLYETGEGVEIGPDADNLLEIDDLEAGELNTIDVDKDINGDWDNGAKLYIKQSNAMPMTILALVPHVSLNEG